MQEVSVWLSWRPRGDWRALGVRGERPRGKALGRVLGS